MRVEGGNKYILTWETLDTGTSMHNNCNAPLDLSRFPPRSSLFVGAHVRAYIYIHISSQVSMTLARFYPTTKVSAFVRTELRHCLPVGKYYSNRMPRGVRTIMFSFATNPISDRIVSIVGLGKRSSRAREKGRERPCMKMFAVDDFVAREGKHVFFPSTLKREKLKLRRIFDRC